MKNLFLVVVLGLAIAVLSPEWVFAQSVEIHTEVDRAPKFKGKPSNVEKFFERHMNYPNEARLEIIEGVVEVSCVVTTDGKLMEPDIEKSVDPLLDSEALRLVRLMQDWKPARKNGELVNARITLPVTFELSSQEKEMMQTLKEQGLTDNMPLFVIDDKIVKEYIVVPHYNVKSVRVLKGEKAIERYGEKAKNGVVIITTKRGTPPVR